MTTTSFNLRSIPPRVMLKLKQEAEKQHLSVNILILKLIENGIGFSHQVSRPTYHDLDKLAGTWTAADSKQFAQNIKDFEKIDKDLWS